MLFLHDCGACVCEREREGERLRRETGYVKESAVVFDSMLL